MDTQFNIKPYCQEEDQTHKRFFGYDECAYCGALLCMYCDGTIPAIGYYYTAKYQKYPVCAAHEKAHQPTNTLYFRRF